MLVHLPISSHRIAGTLSALAIFGALSAFAGAVLAMFAHGGGVPLDYLVGSPFTSYLIPGLILGTIVGGTQLAAGVALLARSDSALLLAAIAGFGMLIWIFVELAVMKQYSWLQTAYFAYGSLELILVLALLGLVPGLVGPLHLPKPLPLNS
jgi:hypothetical protein